MAITLVTVHNSWKAALLRPYPQGTISGLSNYTAQNTICPIVQWIGHLTLLWDIRNVCSFSGKIHPSDEKSA